ncbi:MAG TPA: TetR/AcrR family transcriptional regulator C-terminal domain-containing protein [Nocardioides sp.]|uniref:TetR/AcrR family transcriptional regulator C-terminal domain-containing protein n=1 Tax=Nocardioides sp. TaxID=35761 RepID=UPI002E2FC0FC|nr:TetR/AcrR family transcriptional regulator C-terminal domain-containing protein [Nocardioides sp.]HEX5088096.1 TetR/AcrR family transcriptional regulator C-terminal domain-containing protein [Nocardioides sp.]
MSREPLSRDRILRAALAVADDGGLDRLTIRSLAQQLGTKPMSMYHYVANKGEILDGLVDLVFAEIELPAATGDWRAEMTRRARSAIEVLRRHPWSIGLLESRTTPGPATLAHHDATIAALRAGGFSIVETAHAYAVLDAFTYGFAVQLSSLPFEGPDSAAEVAESIMAAMAGAYPHLAEFAEQHALQPGYDFADEFEFGLGLVLDGLGRMVER